jgi:hypothetical protein
MSAVAVTSGSKSMAKASIVSLAENTPIIARCIVRGANAGASERGGG